MIGQSIAHYRITSKLGQGGMGEVYRATDTKLNRDVAIKILPVAFANDPDRMARFAREAQVLAALNHPNIASIYGVEERALVMELVEGEMLAGPLPIETAIEYAGQIIEALKAAHEKGIVHRDLKPANVKVSSEGVVKVLDFGLAKAASDEPAGDTEFSPTLSLAATRAGIILGTAGYMAPEQARGRAADTRADIWAFGVVLYEMLTGHRLFDGETVSDTLALVLTKQPDWNLVPKQTHRLLRACLTRDPRQRLQAIGDARLLLDEAMPAEIVRPVEGRSSRWIPWVAAGVLAVMAAAVSLLHFREQPLEKRLLQYTVAAPEKAKTLSHFAVSPDGRHIVMRAAGQQGIPQLWVRSLDSLDAHLLSGTDSASYPFWSPDSRYIAFFADNKLKKISVGGGPAQPLSPAGGTGQGGTWNDEGVILFAVYNPGSSGIYRVGAAGGEPTRVTKAEQGAHRLPVFLPDGRRFLFVATGEKDNGVLLASLESGAQTRRLTLDVSGAQYFFPADGNRDGHLLFVRDQTLMAQPVNSKTMESSGELFPVTEFPVGRGQNPGDFGYSISAQGILVYSTGSSGSDQQLVWFDRSGKDVGAVGTLARVTTFALSTDGKRIAVSRQRGDPSRADLWVSGSQTGPESRITFDESRSTYPVWSPDGRRIAFTSNRVTGLLNLYSRASDGLGQDELLYESKEPKIPTDWSRDGRFLIFRQLSGGNTGEDLWALPMTGEKKPIALVNGPAGDHQGQLSRDMKWLAYTSNESNRVEVYVQPFGPGFEKPVTGKWQISIAGGAQPRWRDDGKELFYMAPDRKLMAVDIRAIGETFDRGTPQPLFESPSDIVPTNPGPFGYAPSPDGKRFLIVTRPGASGESPPLTVVVNWLAGVKK